eukprot:13967080-Alexandrium_andersonii.AAC.1
MSPSFRAPVAGSPGAARRARWCYGLGTGGGVLALRDADVQEPREPATRVGTIGGLVFSRQCLGLFP